jgi:hypothetical protein
VKAEFVSPELVCALSQALEHRDEVGDLQQILTFAERFVTVESCHMLFRLARKYPDELARVCEEFPRNCQQFLPFFASLVKCQLQQELNFQPSSDLLRSRGFALSVLANRQLNSLDEIIAGAETDDWSALENEISSLGITT